MKVNMMRHIKTLLAVAVLVVPAVAYSQTKPATATALSLPTSVEKLENLVLPQAQQTPAVSTPVVTPNSAPITAPVNPATGGIQSPNTQAAPQASAAPGVITNQTAASRLAAPTSSVNLQIEEASLANNYTPTIIRYASNYQYPSSGLPKDVYLAYLKSAVIVLGAGMLLACGVLDGFATLFQGAGQGLRATRRLIFRGQQ